MDFDDLLVNTVRLLEDVPDVREHWTRTFRYVLVDEYQDTNHAQYRIVRALSSRWGNVCVVGDSDQSIYSWRGADIRNMLDFERDFPNAVTVRLERNYRSTQKILDAANSVIEQNRDRQPKRLWSDLGAGRAGAAGGGRGRARGGPLRRRPHRERARHGALRRGDRRLLPHQRAVARAGGRAAQRRPAVPRHRRHEVLRPRRDQGRDGVPAGHREPGGRRLAAAHRQQPAPRHRRHHGLAADPARGGDGADAARGAARRRVRAAGRRGEAQRRGLRPAAGRAGRGLAGRDGRRAARARARPERLPRGASARSARSRRAAGWRTSTSSSASRASTTCARPPASCPARRGSRASCRSCRWSPTRTAGRRAATARWSR